ncbi:hypothetical protein E2C01_039730 [Portunus trituberculatus]|uniref:Uncharacterized protein n=1 Tax=Portunus trituberculatus TaxID=210409 RepID=A0A5B7FHS5_PORTR|nr:hypothetical protein [Portunus trituberculatus]
MLWPIVPLDIIEEYVWKAQFSFHTLVVQAILFIAILFIVIPILGPISPPKRIFGVTI